MTKRTLETKTTRPGRPGAEFARMKHPTTPGLYYSAATGYWVSEGWTVWDYDKWKEKFGRGFNEATGTDVDGRSWEFFGYRIPLIRAE